MNTIQEHNRRLYVVIQDGGQFEYYPTVLDAQLFYQNSGNHNGEEVVLTAHNLIYTSLDGVRKYPLMDDKPEWAEGVKLEVAVLPLPPVVKENDTKKTRRKWR